MDLGLEGKVAFVTGGSLGIGKATAAELAGNGVNVAIVARDANRLARVADELSSNDGGKVIPIAGDMSRLDEIERCFAEAKSKLGTVDILINNAGSSPAGRLQDVADEDWVKSFNLKFMGYVRCARTALPDMRAQKWGRIINVTGMGGEMPSAGYMLGAYNAGLAHFTSALAQDAAKDNVIVSAISPGAVDTPRWQTMLQQTAKATGKTVDQVSAERSTGFSLGRPAKVLEIAGLAAYLCSEQAAYIAGAQISVNGATTKGV
ncbi:MAG: SDR family NAD(P)-dependent oxidoreductase [Alphaproteobacteria bacterium]